MNVIFLYLSGIFIVLLLILIPVCMKCKARWLRMLASWLTVNLAAMLTTFLPFAQAAPLVRLGFVLSAAVACVVLFCRPER